MRKEKSGKGRARTALSTWEEELLAVGCCGVSLEGCRLEGVAQYRIAEYK